MELFPRLAMVSSFKYLSFIFIFTSCEISEKYIDKPIPYGGDKIVINALLKADDKIVVYIQKTVPNNCMDCDDTIKDLEIQLYKNYELFCEFIHSKDFCFEPIIPVLAQSKETYQLKINNIYPEVSTQNHSIVNMITIDTAFISEFDRSYLKYCITDEEAETINYYIIKSYEQDTTISFTFNDVVIGFKTKLHNYDSIKIKPSHKILKVYKLSYDLYMYLKSIYENEGSESDPYNERPNLVYSNINGGYGIWASYSESKYYFNISK